MARSRDSSRDAAAYAANWRQVIAADATVGAVGVGAGVVLLFALGSVVLGAGLVAAGGLYLAAVLRRTRRWRRLRSEARL
jgi:hypothetical protein